MDFIYENYALIRINYYGFIYIYNNMTEYIT